MKAALLLAVMVSMVCACDDEVVVRHESVDAGVDSGTSEPPAWIYENLPIGEGEMRCEPGSGVALLSGVFDISGGSGSGTFCRKDYVMRLEASGANEPVTFAEAVVELTTSAGQSILFDLTDPPLPNPRTVVLEHAGDAGDDAEAFVEVLAVPFEYAQQLATVDRIDVRVVLRGEDASGDAIETAPFAFPLALCEGCLTRCESQLEAEGLSREELVGDKCDDDAAADGRYCIDPDC